MNITALLVAFFTPTPDAQAVADLFDALDRDQNGLVASNEISDAQQPCFQRALRVADRNLDGQLTREELTAAVADPDPVTVESPGRAGNRGNFNLAQFDRNKDGKIARAELPPPLQERFQRVIDQYGQDRIPLDVLERLTRGQAAGATPAIQPRPNRASSREDSEKMDAQEMSRRPQARGGRMTEADRSRLIRAVKRLDADGDGRLNRREAAAAPGLVRLLDRDQDGQLSNSELAAINNRPTPRK
ncbi:MAG: hypothetical protein RIK87_18460 [Fuerstiella sp.]